jgi:hypothetical protein
MHKRKGTVMSVLLLDPTGTSRRNQFQEKRFVNETNGQDNYFIVPENAPFFKEGFSLFSPQLGRFLEEGDDFEFTERFGEASDIIGSEIYGSFAFLDKAIEMEVIYVYNALGGDFVVNPKETIMQGLESLQKLRKRDWSDVINVDSTLPIEAHALHLDDMEAGAKIIEILGRWTQHLTKPIENIHVADIVDFEEKHTQPLLTAINRVASILRAKRDSFKVNKQSIFFEHETEEQYFPQDTVVETGLEIICKDAGSYMVEFNCPMWEGNRPARMDATILVNGLDTGYTTSTGMVIPLQSGDRVSLALTAINRDIPKLQLKCPGNSTSLIITQIK